MVRSIHKDCSADVTISKIRSLLSEVGIFPVEKHWEQVGDHCFSVRLEDARFPVGTNGKSSRRDFALASAYGEFMERLQNDCLVNSAYGLMGNQDPSYPDAIRVPLKTWGRSCPELVDGVFEDFQKDFALIKKTKHSDLALPFLDVNRRKVVHLPIVWIFHVTGSNGMCAGNTPEEALAQGICEILERYSLKQALLGGMSPPTIPVTEVREESVRNQIRDFEDLGFDIMIKDCSLGGMFPVVAVIARDRDTSEYCVSFGSDPIFETAVSRCISELVQGWNAESFRGKLKAYNLRGDSYQNQAFADESNKRLYEFLSGVKTANSNFPIGFFLSTKPSQHRRAFARKFTSHRDLLQFVVDRVKKCGYSLYVRDVSFLGFPSYFAYIPGLSEELKITRDMLKVFSSSDFIDRTLLGLGKATNRNLARCAELVERSQAIPRYYVDDYFSRSTILMKRGSESCSFLSTSYLLALMFEAAGNFKKAFVHLDRFLKEYWQTLEDKNLFMAFLIYYRGRAKGKKRSVWIAELRNLLGEAQAKAFLEGLAKRKSPFEAFTLPACGNCSKCSIRGNCYYLEWRAIHEKLEDRLRQSRIDQGQLLSVFDAPRK